MHNMAIFVGLSLVQRKHVIHRKCKLLLKFTQSIMKRGHYDYSNGVTFPLGRAGKASHTLSSPSLKLASN